MTRVAAGLSTASDTTEAAAEAGAQASAGLAGEPPDLAILFLSQHHRDDAPAAAAALRAELPAAGLVGCVAQGVVGGNREVEDGPGVAVWTASLPGTRIECFHASLDDDGSVGGLPDVVDADLVALLVDPFTFPIGPFLEDLNDDFPGLPIVGGLAVGGTEPGQQALIVGDEVHESGAVGAVLSGVRVRALVSQGCAPIGHDAVVTQAEENVVFELAGRPALERLRDEIAALPRDQQALATRGLLCGLVIDENKPDYGRGDYLIRGVLGADEESGAIAVGERARVGQTLRFHVRDAASADEDLRETLRGSLADERPAGALIFTCNGRGAGMFGETDHDARLVAEALASSSVAGLFCGGEIGPVGGRTFLHGFTATLAVFLDG
jgi:small ligand-binding sensory domain FIST